MSFSGGLAIVGGFTVFFHLLKLTWRCWCGFRTFVLSEVWQVDLKIYGQWAVVTGATSGIGKAYAHELAQRGLDVVLISRSNDKLEMAAKEIETKYGRKVRTIQTDFTHGHSIYPAIAEGLKGLEIGVLVNNVGMTYSENFDYFLEAPNSEEKITHVINCNMLSVAQMTRLVLPDMVERGTGLIINIASGVGVRPQPLLTLYSATKSFVTYFSQGLHAEYKSRGITVQATFVSPHKTNRGTSEALLYSQHGTRLGSKAEYALARLTSFPNSYRFSRLTSIWCSGFWIDGTTGGGTQSQCLYLSRVLYKCVSPLIVSTNMTYHIKHSTINRFMKSAPDFAREALNTVGHSSYTSGCLSHALQSVALITLLPDWFRLSSFCVRKMEDFAKLSKKPLKTEKLKGKDD